MLCVLVEWCPQEKRAQLQSIMMSIYDLQKVENIF